MAETIAVRALLTPQWVRGGGIKLSRACSLDSLNWSVSNSKQNIYYTVQLSVNGLYFSYSSWTDQRKNNGKQYCLSIKCRPHANSINMARGEIAFLHWSLSVTLGRPL